MERSVMKSLLSNENACGVTAATSRASQESLGLGWLKSSRNGSAMPRTR